MSSSNHIFLIEPNSAGHRPSVDGRESGTFATLDAADAAGGHIARRFLAAAALTFEPDFKWTLSDLEIRAAMLECAGDGPRGECICG
jgi:hypothetical protein